MGTFNCIAERPGSSNLKNDRYTFKNVQFIGDTGSGKTKQKRQYLTVREYLLHIRQPQYQHSKVKEHLRVCGNGEFRIFPLPQVPS